MIHFSPWAGRVQSFSIPTCVQVSVGRLFHFLCFFMLISGADDLKNCSLHFMAQYRHWSVQEAALVYFLSPTLPPRKNSDPPVWGGARTEVCAFRSSSVSLTCGQGTTEFVRYYSCWYPARQSHPRPAESGRRFQGILVLIQAEEVIRHVWVMLPFLQLTCA